MTHATVNCPPADYALYLAYRLPKKDRLRRIALSKPRRNDIFIAYAPADGSFVRPIDEALREQGLDPWIDYDDILAGLDYDAQFRQGIRGADVFVLVSTTNTFSHKRVATGLKLAQHLNKLVLIVARQPTLPDKSQGSLLLEAEPSLDWLEVKGHTGEDTFNELAQTIIHIQSYVRLQARAVRWDQQHRSEKALLSKEDLEAVRKRIRWIEKHSLDRHFHFTALQKDFLQAIDLHLRSQKRLAYARQIYPEVFISYSSRDREFVKELVAALKAHQWNVWVDWENIPVATRWQDEVREGIRVAHTLIFVISQASVLSENCQLELNIAQQHNKRIIPVVCKEDYREAPVKEVYRKIGLSSIIHVSYTKNTPEVALGELLGALSMNLEDTRIYNRLLNKASEWADHDRSEQHLLPLQELTTFEQWQRQRELDDAQDQREIQPLLPLQKEYLRSSRNCVASRRRKQFLGMTSLTTLIGVFSVLLTIATVGEIRALVASLEDRRELDALITALRAGKRLKRNHLLVGLARPTLRPQATTALHAATLGLREMNRLTGHQEDIFDIAFSPDGQQIASVGADLSLKLWNVSDSQLVEDVSGSHAGKVVSVDYSSDGMLLATGSYDGHVKLWTTDGKLVERLSEPHDDPVLQVSFSPGGQYLASNSFDGKVHLWNRGNEFATPIVLDHGSPVYDVAFSRYGNTLVSGDEKGQVKLWNRQGELIDETQYGSSVYDVEFSPNGREVAIAGVDGTVMLWTPKTENTEGKTEVIGRHEDTIYQLAFNATGETLASASGDSTVKLWSLVPGKEKTVYTLRGHQQAVYRVEFSPDDRIVATAGADNSVRLWLRETGTALEVLEGHEDEVLKIAFSPRTFHNHTLEHNPSEQSAAQSFNTKAVAMLASSSKDGEIRLWNIDDRIIPLPHDNRVFDVAFRPDGKVIASGGVHNIRLWRPDTKLRSHISAGNEGEVLSITYHPNGKFLAAGLDNNHFKIWKPDITTEDAIIEPVHAHRSDTVLMPGIHTIQFTPDGNWLITGGADQTIKLWDFSAVLQEAQSLRYTLAMAGEVTDMALNKVGNRLLASSRGLRGEAKLWRLSPTGKTAPELIATLDETAGGHPGDVLTVAFNPVTDGIATGGNDGQIKLWTSEGTFITNLWPPTDAVTDLSFSPDGWFLASASADGSIYLWTAEGELISILSRHNREISGLAFSPQGSHLLASASFDNQVLLWRLWNRPLSTSRERPHQSDILNALLNMGCESASTYLKNHAQVPSSLQRLDVKQEEMLSDVREIKRFCEHHQQSHTGS